MIRIRIQRGRIQSGQGMTEYIIIVGLVAILLIGAVSNYKFAVEEAIVGTEAAMDGVGETNNKYNGGGDARDSEVVPPAGTTPAGTFTYPNGTTEPVFKTASGGYVFENGAGLTDAQISGVKP